MAVTPAKTTWMNDASTSPMRVIIIHNCYRIEPACRHTPQLRANSLAWIAGVTSFRNVCRREGNSSAVYRSFPDCRLILDVWWSQQLLSSRGSPIGLARGAWKKRVFRVKTAEFSNFLHRYTYIRDDGHIHGGGGHVQRFWVLS